MAKVHVANTDVEFEYADSSLISLEESWARRPLSLQLQFLPLLYAQPDDTVGVTDFPDENYLAALKESGFFPEALPRMVLINEHAPFEGRECVSWGPSRRVQEWALARKMIYALPADWEMICRINSKAFSFRFNRFPESALIRDEEELVSWLKSFSGPKVLKTCFGLSGMGNRFLNEADSSPSSELLAFCKREWIHKRALVGEPWLDRLADFSTQWRIHKGGKIEWVGATRFETDSRGIYQGTLAGPEDLLFGSQIDFLHQHRHFVEKALDEISAMGFFGSIGFDALLYKDAKNSTVRLYPLVEINGRQTMSLVALRLQRRLSPGQLLKLAFQPAPLAKLSLLPVHLTTAAGKIVHFNKKLIPLVIHNKINDENDITI